MIVELSDEALAEARQMNQFLEDVLASVPSVHTVDPVETRRARATGEGIFPEPVRVDWARDVVVPAPTGDVPVRVFVPEAVDGVFLHIHGGGWVLGASDQQDVRLAAIAEGLGLAVVSVDYRLAPEHPFPAAMDDCEAVARWLLDGAAADLGSTNLLIGGESAGAHLSVLTLLRLRDAGAAVERFLGANLSYGAYDLGGTPSQRSWGERNLVLSGPIVDWFVEQSLPGTTIVERQDPSVSPLYADLSGLPPALFSVGTLDMLLDDSLFMAARWEHAGNRSELEIYPEAIHGFNGFPSLVTTIANGRQDEFLRRCLTR